MSVDALAAKSEVIAAKIKASFKNIVAERYPDLSQPDADAPILGSLIDAIAIAIVVTLEGKEDG